MTATKTGSRTRVPDTKRAIIYVRQSKAKEDSISPETQIEHCMTHIRRNGYTVVGEPVIDLNLTGRTFRKRSVVPIIERVKRGEADVVVVWRWSRWGRNLTEARLNIAELDEVKGKLESATEPIDTTSAAGRFSRNTILAIAEYESDQIGDNWKNARRSMVLKRGLPPTGGARLGYLYEDRKYTIDPVTGPVMKQAYERFIAGDSIANIVRTCRDAGVRSTYGNPLTEQALREWLDSGFAAGWVLLKNPDRILSEEELFDLEHEPGHYLYLPGTVRETKEPAWEALISDEQWDAYRAERRRRAQVGPRARNATRQLSRMVRCAGCGRLAQFYPAKHHWKNDRWACGSRDLKFGEPCTARASITEEALHEAVKTWLRDNRDNAGDVGDAYVRRQLAAASATGDLDSLQRELTRQHKRRDNLLDLIADGELDRKLTKPKTEEIRKEIERLEGAIVEAKQRAAVTALPEVESFGATLDGFDRMKPPMMNRALKILIDAVWIYPQGQDPRVLVRGAWEAKQPVPIAARPRKPDDTGRTCTRCKEWKSLEAFYRRRRGDLIPQCRACKAELHALSKQSA